MTKPANWTTLEWTVATLLLAAGFFFVEVGCGEDDISDLDVPPEDRITVTFRNNGDDNVHILGLGESPINEAPPAGNRLAPGATRPWTSGAIYGVGEDVEFRAVRGGQVLVTRNCPATRAVIEHTANASVVFDEPPSQLLCQGW